jgi:[ribosomal protein S5]-alanine N-acetyltransferase
VTTPFERGTERLLLRRLAIGDLPRFLVYRNDPTVLKYDGADAMTEEEARQFLEEVSTRPLGVPGEWCQIAIELPGAGIIGDCGFQVDRDRPYTGELGYRLDTRQWGRGYGAEAVTGVLDWAFDTLGLHRVIALIDTRNTHSYRLVERLGFRREGEFRAAYQEPDGWSDEYLYAMLDEDWATHRIR